MAGELPGDAATTPVSGVSLLLQGLGVPESKVAEQIMGVHSTQQGPGSRHGVNPWTRDGQRLEERQESDLGGLWCVLRSNEVICRCTGWGWGLLQGSKERDTHKLRFRNRSRGKPAAKACRRAAEAGVSERPSSDSALCRAPSAWPLGDAGTY